MDPVRRVSWGGTLGAVIVSRDSRSVLVVLFAAIVVLLGACASDPARHDIVDALEKGGLERPVAECVADAFGELPEADRKLIAERGSNGVRDDFDDPDEPIDIARRKMSECRNQAVPEPESDSDADPDSDATG